MKLEELFRKVTRHLRDSNHFGERQTWQIQDLLDDYNEALREICKIRPDSFVTTEVITLVAGSFQALPPQATRLLSVNRNMGPDGSTPGPNVRSMSREVLDRFNPCWLDSSPSGSIRNYSYSQQDPTKFWVDPPAVSGTRVEVQFSGVPPTAVSEDDEFALPLVFEPIVIEWMLYREFGDDLESQLSLSRSQQHYQAFMTNMGQKYKADKEFMKDEQLDKR